MYRNNRIDNVIRWSIQFYISQLTIPIVQSLFKTQIVYNSLYPEYMIGHYCQHRVPIIYYNILFNE